MFAKIYTQNEEMLASRFGISGIPTMILFKNGKESKRISGALDEQSMTNWIAN